MPKLCIAACSNFQREVAAVLAQAGHDDVRVAPFAAACGRPLVGDDPAVAVADARLARGDDVAAVGAFCLRRLAERTTPRLRVHAANTCLELVAGAPLVDLLLGQGAYLMTPGWLENWRHTMTEWGFDQETARAFFGETTRKLVLLDTGLHEHSAANLQALGAFLGLPVETIPVGVELFRLFLTKIVAEWRLAQHAAAVAACDDAQRRVAEYAMLFDLVGGLSELRTEHQVAEHLLDLFMMLCAPASAVYLSFANGEPGSIVSSAVVPGDEQIVRTRLTQQQGDVLLAEPEAGFVVQIMSETARLAVIQVTGLAFPTHAAHYLNLAFSLRPIVAMAITQARAFERLEEARRLLQYERDRAQEYLDIAGVIIVALDEAGRVTLLNRRGREILRCGEQDVIGRDWIADFVPERLRDEVRRDFRRIIADAVDSQGSYANLILTYDGAERLIAWRYVLIRDAQGAVRGALSSGEDITEHRRAGEKLQAAMTELARSNADLEHFAYIASHDLQEPLRMIRSYLALLVEDYGDQLDRNAQEFIGFAVDGATRMQQLIQDLLEYSRISSRGQRFVSVTCETVLAYVLRDLGGAIEDSGAIVTHDPLPTVSADPVQLGQLLQNLIGNALKFQGAHPPRVHISARLIPALPSSWQFCVRDNGIGIAPEHAGRIFELFQRLHTREAYPGTGIGLAVCKRIVERHGGRIWVESALGQGSAFYFTIAVDPVTA
jgi:PAS domain S-box-containing protein